MMLSDIKTDEQGRLLALDRLAVLDTEPEQPFENIVSLVQQILQVPNCAVSLVDRQRQRFKARRGLAAPETARNIAFCSEAIKSDAPLSIPETQDSQTFKGNPLVVGEPHIRSYLGVPLKTPEGYVVGTLCAIDTRPREFAESELSVLERFAKVVVDELELRQIASTDFLTGAMARRAWYEAANGEVLRAQRYRRPLSVVIMDIDRFKSINDTHGHPVGDLVIKALARVVMDSLRQSDLFGRYGGEEFVLALPDTDPVAAYALAERLRKAVRQSRLVAPHHLRWTISIGVAEMLCEDATIQPALERADYALYQAKAAGRDQVKVNLPAGRPAPGEIGSETNAA